jgi:predicted amidophosphoribosyltransferase
VAGWEPAEIARTVFVVVDDVATTGATLTEAVRALRKGLKNQGVTAFRVWAGVVAKTVDGKAGGAR